MNADFYTSLSRCQQQNHQNKNYSGEHHLEKKEYSRSYFLIYHFESMHETWKNVPWNTIT